MAATPAIAAAQRAGIAYRVHKYPHDKNSRDYGAEAVAILGARLHVDAAQIFKTLVVSAGDALAVAVLPVPGRLSLKAVAAALDAPKATMAEPAAVTRATGYVLGGVSPLGQRGRLPTVIDSSAPKWKNILCSAGRRGLEIELAPDDLIALTAAVLAPISI